LGAAVELDEDAVDAGFTAIDQAIVVGVGPELVANGGEGGEVVGVEEVVAGAGAGGRKRDGDAVVIGQVRVGGAGEARGIGFDNDVAAWRDEREVVVAAAIGDGGDEEDAVGDVAVAVGVGVEVDGNCGDAGVGVGEVAVGVGVIADLAGDAAVGGGFEEGVEEVVAGIVDEAGDIDGDAVVGGGALGVVNADVADEVFLDDNVGAGVEVEEFVGAVGLGVGDGDEGAIGGIAIAIRVGEEADGDAL